MAYIVPAGCSCDTTGGPSGCAVHHPSSTDATPAGVEVAWSVFHRHAWWFDGLQPDGALIYHCDEHDPPLVRVVSRPL